MTDQPEEFDAAAFEAMLAPSSLGSRAQETPVLSVGNTEPLPSGLPEPLKAILRKGRTEAGYDDQGNKIDSGRASEVHEDAEEREVLTVDTKVVTIDDVINALDPADSEVALKLYGWLVDTNRLRVIGTLAGGMGYIHQYVEPQGATKEGYVAGGTSGGRMVDEALAKAKASGSPSRMGLCKDCISAVVMIDGGTIVTNDNERSAKCAGNRGGPHQIVY